MLGPSSIWSSQHFFSRNISIPLQSWGDLASVRLKDSPNDTHLVSWSLQDFMRYTGPPYRFPGISGESRPSYLVLKVWGLASDFPPLGSPPLGSSTSHSNLQPEAKLCLKVWVLPVPTPTKAPCPVFGTLWLAVSSAPPTPPSQLSDVSHWELFPLNSPFWAPPPKPSWGLFSQIIPCNFMSLNN